jgi:hypothetical protein
MSVYKRGETYWFKFLFQGQQIRESARTNSKTVAREAERARRRDLELGLNRIGKRKPACDLPRSPRDELPGTAADSPSGAVLRPACAAVAAAPGCDPPLRRGETRVV